MRLSSASIESEPVEDQKVPKRSLSGGMNVENSCDASSSVLWMLCDGSSVLDALHVCAPPCVSPRRGRSVPGRAARRGLLLT